MTDQEIVEAAYAAQLQDLFTTLWSSCSAGNDASDAATHFKNGVALLRATKAKALAQL